MLYFLQMRFRSGILYFWEYETDFILMLCFWGRVRQGLTFFCASYLASHFSVNSLNTHRPPNLVYLVQLDPCGFIGICESLLKKRRRRFAALGTRVDAPQCLIRVICLAASAPYMRQPNSAAL